MKTTPLVIAALFAVVSAEANLDVADAQKHLHDKISDSVNPDKVKNFNTDLVNFDRSVRSAGRAIRRDFRDYDL
jgi:ribulose kinase